MLAQQNGKVAVAALGSLLLSSGFGWLPVARFVAPRTPPRPIPPKPVTPDPLPPTMTNVPSHGTVKVGPLTFEAMLSQSKLAAGTDGTVFVDVKLTADALRVRADERRPIDFALVLDVSGSMTEANRIGLLKEACLGLRQQLSDQDRVSVVSFSTAARTLHGLEKPSPEYDEAIRSLVARGGTNISEGLELGAEELRKAVRPGAARRVILLTDGDPTLGDKTPEGLRGICSRLAQQGISVSVVGLGLEYQSRLLSDMAEAGGGTYHFVDRPERIGGIYDAELRTLRTLVARGVTVTLEATNGAQLLDLIEWNGARDGNKITINAGDFESGRSTKIVARLKARTWRDG
ncbi:MAG: VWA domain-containing protein, partial [Planctomycetota bacterium]